MILFSHELFAIQNYGGITRGMIELMRALHARDYDWMVWAGTHGNQPLEAFRREPGVAPRVVAEPAGPLPGRLRASLNNEWHFRSFARSYPKAIIHRTQYVPIDLLPAGRVKVSTLHDMWTEHKGASRWETVRSGFKRRALEASDAIVCVSEHTRQAMIETWPHLADRSVTIHHGARPVSETPIAPSDTTPYFLYVGARERRKNFTVLLHAMAQSRRLGDVRLVCAGGGAFNEHETALIAELGLGERVIQRRTNDDELAGLYEAAVALVYPSTFEGFGMPLVEAMLHGCPVISSPLSCLPEIGGDAPIYAEAHNPLAWADAMETMAYDTQATAKARAVGYVRARAFSWNKTATLHGQLYEKLR